VRLHIGRGGATRDGFGLLLLLTCRLIQTVKKWRYESRQVAQERWVSLSWALAVRVKDVEAEGLGVGSAKCVVYRACQVSCERGQVGFKEKVSATLEGVVDGGARRVGGVRCELGRD
jgi:hypothetical protein